MPLHFQKFKIYSLGWNKNIFLYLKIGKRMLFIDYNLKTTFFFIDFHSLRSKLLYLNGTFSVRIGFSVTSRFPFSNRLIPYRLEIIFIRLVTDINFISAPIRQIFDLHILFTYSRIYNNFYHTNSSCLNI